MNGWYIESDYSTPSEPAKQMINSPKAIKAIENNIPITFVYYSEGEGVKTKTYSPVDKEEHQNE